MPVGYNVATGDRRDFQTRFIYPDLDTGDTGDAVNTFQMPVPPVLWSVQVEGLSDSTVTIQGSLDGSTSYTVKDTAAADVAITADGVTQISGSYINMRPVVSGGTDTGVVVTFFVVA